MKSLKFKMIAIIIIVLIISFFISFKRVIDKPLNITKDIVISVKAGDSFYSIINTLSNKKQIKNVSLIKLFVKISKKNIDVKEGEYVLQEDLSINELINKLTSETSLNAIKFTIPEGYTIDDISEKLEKEGICSKGDFIMAINDYELPSFIKVNNKKRYNLEGYLFPDTYLIKVGETPKDIITKMISRFEEMLDISIKETNITLEEEKIENIITIASMIEKEAKIDCERPIISSVINNRLNINMMLQIDATVIYALGEHVDVVSEANLEEDSPYNTYKNYGLPIGPISNPGLESIKAALKPENTDYLFYILIPKSNEHNFTSSGEEFENLREEYGYND